MTVIALHNAKGGVGKTTESIHLAYGLSYENSGSKILLVDLDGQNSLKTYFRLKMDKLDTYEFIINNADIDQCIYPMPIQIGEKECHVDIMPASAKMAAFDTKTANIPGRENLLRLRFEEEKISNKYDYVIIDCPPSFSQNTINALAASHFAVVPAVMDDYATTSIDYIRENIHILKRNLRLNNPELLGVLPTQYDPRQSVSSAIYSGLVKRYQDLKIFNPIRLNAAYRKAQIQRSVVFASEKSPFKATEDNIGFVKEILLQIKQRNKTASEEAQL
ncbi:MAG: ParA family protein [Bdellovibrionaceae bacterium]|nr:ParA family protein [Pseudobdellovibrionaceae bacterium]